MTALEMTLAAVIAVGGSLGLWRLLAWGLKAATDAIGRGLQGWVQLALDKEPNIGTS